MKVVKLQMSSMYGTMDVDVYRMALEDNLPNISTAQTINAGKTGKARVDAYMTDIKSGKAGYMACLKNIRTLIESGISEKDLKVWANMITDPKKVSKSMMLPFRFVDAWSAVEGLAVDAFKLKIVKGALEKAFALSAGNTNIAGDGEKVAILLDESGSMGGSMWSRRDENKKDPWYIGKTLAASMKVGMDEDSCLFYTWADTCTRRDIGNMSPFDFIRNLNTRGGGTDVAAPLKELIRTKTYVNKVIIFTDMQLYGGWSRVGDQLKNYLNEYKRNVNPDVKVLFWNLSGMSGGAPVDLEKVQDVMEVAGFSDQMLKVIPRLWSDKNFLIKEINAVEL